MSLFEIVYRLGQYRQKVEEKAKTKYFDHREDTYARILKRQLQQTDIKRWHTLDFQNLEEYKAFETYKFFNQEINVFHSIDWHLDVSTGRSFPLTFSKDIDIRSDKYGSAKVVWELNRLQFLIPLLLRYKASKDAEDLRRFQQLVTDWIEVNPYLRGVNWYSNIEVNIRLIVWYYCWELLFSEEDVVRDTVFLKFAEKVWLPSIYEHCVYSFSNPSKFSSANNHLVAEYSGLFMASLKWSFPESAKWNKYAQKGLEKEIQMQYSQGGVNKEQAAEYIQFITDFFLIPYAASQERNSGQFSEMYKSKLYKIFNYIYELLDINKGYRKYGDEDDGKVLAVSLNQHFDNFSSILTSGAILFNEGKFKAVDNGFDLKNLLLFGSKRIYQYNLIGDKNIQRNSAFYPEDGQFIFRKQEGIKEIYLHFDAAPLGFLSIAAHGHADALSLALHVHGTPVLVDVGTYTYHTEREWREYFVSTRAHNTLCIDLKNQAELTGPTMWHKHYRCEVLDVQQGSEIEKISATHSGYKGINCQHIRTINFLKKEDKFIIEDEIVLDRIDRTVELPWHLHPDIIIEGRQNNEFLLKNRTGKELGMLILSLDLDISLHKGKEKPFLGWYSDAFMVKRPTTTILGRLKTKGIKKIKIKSEINIAF